MSVADKIKPGDDVIYADLIKSFGAWDRSGSEKHEKDWVQEVWKEGNLKGVRIDVTWKELEREKGVFNWAKIDKPLKSADDCNLNVYFQLLIGPDSPSWVYDLGVPKVRVHNPKKDEYGAYPYYPDEGGLYIKFLGEAIQQISEHFYASEIWKKRLRFIQVATGSTGDEAPYKGGPVESHSDYALTDTDQPWNEYRQKVFALFVQHFQTDKTPVIPLLFNKMGPHANAHQQNAYLTEFNYIKNDVKYVGRKGSVLPRGYNLNEMNEFIDGSVPYPLSEKRTLPPEIPEKIFLFTRAEMDQTWKRPFFNDYLALSMYWSALNALHGGLSVWDLSMDVVFGQVDEYNWEKRWVFPAIQFFNKYAPQMFPESSNHAFIAFFKGLDTYDVIQFPIDEDGPYALSEYPVVTETKEDGQPKTEEEKQAEYDLLLAGRLKRDLQRYNSIISEYSSFGAKISDDVALTLGQVAQRKEVGGLQDLNDIGFKVPRENYSRFITQLEADTYDQALWRIDHDPNPEKSDKMHYPKESRFARRLRNDEMRDSGLYLLLDEAFVSGGEALSIKVHYFFKGLADFKVMYSSATGEKTAFRVREEEAWSGKGEWRVWPKDTEREILDDVDMTKKIRKGCHIAVTGLKDKMDIEDASKLHNDVFHMVEVENVSRTDAAKQS